MDLAGAGAEWVAVWCIERRGRPWIVEVHESGHRLAVFGVQLVTTPPVSKSANSTARSVKSGAKAHIYDVL